MNFPGHPTGSSVPTDAVARLDRTRVMQLAPRVDASQVLADSRRVTEIPVLVGPSRPHDRREVASGR